MANYKVVDADQLDADLETVADAIREAGGTSDRLAFPDGFVGAAKALLSGGGLPIGVTALASGTYTCTRDPVSAVGIEHGLGITPNFFILYAEGEPISYSDYYYYISLQVGLSHAFADKTSSFAYFKVLRYGDPSTFRQTAAQGSSLDDFANESVFYVYNSATYQLKAGVTYRWVAGVVGGI